MKPGKLLDTLRDAEAAIGIVVFGVFTLLADVVEGRPGWAMGIRLLGLALFIGYAWWVLSKRPRFFAIPFVLTEERRKEEIRSALLQPLVQAVGGRYVESGIRRLGLSMDDLYVSLEPPGERLRNDPDASHWQRAWDHLIEGWEDVENRTLSRSVRYHVLPNIVNPLSFAVGATVGLRRPVILYHRNGGTHAVLQLQQPRVLFTTPPPEVDRPETVTFEGESKGSGERRLILHIVINDRHLRDADADAIKRHFAIHPRSRYSTNTLITYRGERGYLPEKASWLPQVQYVVQESRRLVGAFDVVELVLITPSAVAFALGMAFSRETKTQVCQFFTSPREKYAPVFSLRSIEAALPFN